MKRLIFTHIQKAAGNSVNAFFDIIRDRCGANVLAFAGAPSTDLASPQTILEQHGLDYQDFDIITGHVPYAAANACFGSALYTTVLRDPVARLLSDFCSQPFHQTLPDGGLSRLREALDERAEYAIDNLQVRMLCDRPNFGEPARLAMLNEAKYNLQTYYSVVGFAENFNTLLGELSRIYNVPPPGSWDRINATPPYEHKISDEDRVLAARYNRLDVELYAWARSQHFAVSGRIEKRNAAGGKVIAGGSFVTHIAPLS